MTSGKNMSQMSHVAGQQFECAFADIGNRKSNTSAGHFPGLLLRLQACVGKDCVLKTVETNAAGEILANH
jgi:hypothetical protein